MSEQFRVYLKGELGKLDSQDKVNAFVDNLTDHDADFLCRACSNLRTNGAYRNLIQFKKWNTERFPVDHIYLCQAEPTDPVRAIFWSHKVNWPSGEPTFSLAELAKDSRLWECPPYSDWVRYPQNIEFRTCLGEPDEHDHVRLFDGVHRALWMARTEPQTAIPVCLPV